MTTTTSTSTAKIPTIWLPYILDYIIDIKREWIEHEKADRVEGWLGYKKAIPEEEKDSSICEYIKHIIKDKNIISFNHVEQELRFLDMMLNVILKIEDTIDATERIIPYYIKCLNSGQIIERQGRPGEIIQMESDEFRRELKKEEELLPYSKLQLKTFNEYIEIFDPDKTKRSLLKARDDLAFIEYETKQKKLVEETVKRCDKLLLKRPNNIYATQQSTNNFITLHIIEDRRNALKRKWNHQSHTLMTLGGKDVTLKPPTCDICHQDHHTTDQHQNGCVVCGSMDVFIRCAECKNLHCLDHEKQTICYDLKEDDLAGGSIFQYYCTLCFPKINDKFLYCRYCDMWYEDRTAFVDHIDECKGRLE